MGLFSNIKAFLKALLAAMWRKTKEQRKTSNSDCEISNHRKNFIWLWVPFPHVARLFADIFMAGIFTFFSTFWTMFPLPPRNLKIIYLCLASRKITSRHNLNWDSEWIYEYRFWSKKYKQLLPFICLSSAHFTDEGAAGTSGLDTSTSLNPWRTFLF